MIRVADYVMQRLVQEGVHHLFMVTGRGMLYLSDAAAKEEGLTCVCPHHEQAAAYAAMAYAQTTGGLGACMVSTGCAGTNAVTGVLCAWQDDIPCVFISGQNTLKETVRHTKIPVRTFGQQEADIVSVVAPITRYAVMIEDPARIAFELDKAFHLARSGRKGPVWIDIPLDIQNMRVEPEELERFRPAEAADRIAEADLAYAREQLEKAKRPVVLIGSGIRSAGAEDRLAQLVERTDVPLVFSSSAADVFGTRNALSLGAVGTMGAGRAANFAVQNADFVLAIGSRLTSMTVGSAPEKFARAAKIMAVDIDENEFRKGTVRLDRAVKADAKVFLEKLGFPFRTPPEWVEKCRHWKEIFPRCEDFRRRNEKVDLYVLGDALSRVLPDDGIFVTDAGLEELILPTTIAFGAEQRCIQPASQGAMGYALPAAVGAFCAAGRTVVAATGDGSVMMNLQELQTIAHNRFPIKLLIINNNCYAVIRRRQKDLFRTRTVGTDATDGVSCPDFSKAAACFGLPYERIEGPDGLEERLKEILATDGPVICEILSPEDQNYLHSSYARTARGRFVQRPLEDQSPYLDRELFLSEMIIDPIDQ